MCTQAAKGTERDLSVSARAAHTQNCRVAVTTVPPAGPLVGARGEPHSFSRSRSKPP